MSYYKYSPIINFDVDYYSVSVLLFLRCRNITFVIEHPLKLSAESFIFLRSLISFCQKLGQEIELRDRLKF